MTEKASGFRGGESVAVTGTMIFNAVSQLLWPDKDREEWFSLGENHEKVLGFGLHQLLNRYSLRLNLFHQPCRATAKRQREPRRAGRTPCFSRGSWTSVQRKIVPS